MDPIALRERCESRLASVPIPIPFDLTAFCTDLGRTRGRPITVVLIAMDARSPSGLWLSGTTADYIVCEQATTPLHRTHIALHEIGHLLCGHQPGGPGTGAHLDRLFPHLAPSLVRSALARTSYSTDEESEAEMLASLILQRAQLGSPDAIVDPDTAGVLSRLGSSL